MQRSQASGSDSEMKELRGYVYQSDVDGRYGNRRESGGGVGPVEWARVDPDVLCFTC